MRSVERSSTRWVIATAVFGISVSACQNATLFGLKKPGSVSPSGNSQQISPDPSRSAQPATLDPATRQRDRIVDPVTDTSVVPANSSFRRWSQFATNGGTHCATAVNSDNTEAVYCWGDNGSGQVGIGHTSQSVATPHQVLGLGHVSVLSIAVGGGQGTNYGHACAVVRFSGGSVGLLEPELHCWGINYSGQLGLEGFEQVRAAPERVLAFQPYLKQVVAGQKHTCIRFSDEAASVGYVQCTGTNESGQLGVDVPLDPNHTNGGERSAQFLNVQGLSGADVVQLRAGSRHNCAVVRIPDGANPSGKMRFMCWGDNGAGQSGGLAFATAADAPSTVWRAVEAYSGPIFAGSPMDVSQLELGTNHSCALDWTAALAPDVVCWGDNRQAQIAPSVPNRIQVRTPTSVQRSWGTDRIRSFFATGSSTCVETVGSGLFCRGDASRVSPPTSNEMGEFSRIPTPAAGLLTVSVPLPQGAFWLLYQQALQFGLRDANTGVLLPNWNRVALPTSSP